MYKFISIISALIRQFLLPNPYINLFSQEVYADLFNIIIGGIILHKLSFWLTGMAYTRGINEPAEGSVGYLFSYIILTLLITFLSKIISNIWIMVCVFLIIYILLCIVVSKTFNRHNYF